MNATEKGSSLTSVNFTDPAHREQLAAWREAHLGQPGTGFLANAIRTYLKGTAPASAVIAAIAASNAFEEKQARRRQRHEHQAWVRQPSLIDGQIYETLTVWQPERGEFSLSNARFTAEKPVGESLATMFNFGREVGGGTKTKRAISERIGYLQEVQS